MIPRAWPMLSAILFFISAPLMAVNNPLLTALTEEMNRSYQRLSVAQPVPLYYLQYEVWDERQFTISASLGAITAESDEWHRNLDVDVRVGSARLDNTHEIRSGGFDLTDYLPSNREVPIDHSTAGLKVQLWALTDQKFKAAQERFTKVLAERQVKVLESDTSADFTAGKAVTFIKPAPAMTLDKAVWRDRLKRLSVLFRSHPWILNSSISISAVESNRYLVNSEQARILDGSSRYNLRINVSTMAEDGMELYLGSRFYAISPERLPEEAALRSKIDSLIENLNALRLAPVVEPYSGPAILMNQACGVFFHEIFGHRIEGHRQKSEFEGQTFTKKIGQAIMPDFISIFDDPTMEEFNGRDLNGHYHFDDEGIAAQKAEIVTNGIMKGFLLSRSPIAGFPFSNGHGRRSYGRRVVTRQGVLCIKSSKEVPIEELRRTLIEECKKQNKPYGLVFYDIAGGFTTTGREGTQSFKVIPLFVKRVYVDGRPDEVVRGVDVVGTPLLSLSKIVLTGNDYEIFNGTCGAESGWVPVSAVAPSILVSEIEVEKKAKGQDKPPILSAPPAQP